MGFQRHANMTSAESGPDVTPKTESGRALTPEQIAEMRRVHVGTGGPFTADMCYDCWQGVCSIPLWIATYDEAASKAVAEVMRLHEKSDDDPDKPAPYWDGWHDALDAAAALIDSERKP